MFTKKVKKSLSALLLSSFVFANVLIPLANAQTLDDSRLSGLERQELSTQVNITPEEAKSLVIDTNLALLKIATGIDVKTLPFISALFPKADSVDYQRIAQDVSRIIKDAFVENNIFEQKAALGTAAAGLKRLAVTDTKDDHTTLLYMALLDNIMQRTSQTDLRLISAGYWASAAQMNLNTMGFRTYINPTNPKLKDDLWQSAFSYRQTINALSTDLRKLQEAEIGKSMWDCYVNQYGVAVYWNDIDKKPNYFKTLTECQNGRKADIASRATNTAYLDKLSAGWIELEVATLGGEKGLDSYRKLIDPATARLVVGDPVFGISEVVNNFTGYSLSPGNFIKNGGTICKGIDAAVVKATMEHHFPSDQTMKNKLMAAVGCLE